MAMGGASSTRLILGAHRAATNSLEQAATRASVWPTATTAPAELLPPKHLLRRVSATRAEPSYRSDNSAIDTSGHPIESLVVYTEVNSRPPRNMLPTGSVRGSPVRSGTGCPRRFTLPGRAPLETPKGSGVASCQGGIKKEVGRASCRARVATLV